MARYSCSQMVARITMAVLMGGVAYIVPAQDAQQDAGSPAVQEEAAPVTPAPAQETAVPAAETPADPVAVPAPAVEKTEPAVAAPVERVVPDEEFLKTAKKLLNITGKPSKMANDNVVAITQFNVEFGYAHRKETAAYIKSSKMKLDEESYQAMTEIMYECFVAALEKYGWKTVVAKDKVINHEAYKAMGGSEGPRDSKDQWASTRKVGGQGTETVTCSPEGMKVAQAFRAAAQNIVVFPKVAENVGAKLMMNVNIFVDYDTKKDMAIISTSTIDFNKINKRQKMVPFKGAVPGEYVYEGGTTPVNIGLKEPFSTNTKVSDRITSGFFKQSGTFKIDVSAMTGSILKTYERIAMLQAAAIYAGK